MKLCQIKGPYIQLNQLLKLEDLASTGGQARAMIEEGQVKVNGEVTYVIRKKLYQGDTVEANGQTLRWR